MSETIERVLSCPINEINPMDPENLRCPYNMNRRLRDEAPVYLDTQTGIFFISRYEDVVKMSMDHQGFSSRMRPGTARDARSSGNPELESITKKGYPQVETMLTQDPPLQRRYRKFVDGAFSPASLKSLEPFIEKTANELIDAFIDDEQCEFLSAFGVPLPLTVIASQLGVPLTDLHLLRDWTRAFIGNLSQQLDEQGRIKSARSMLEFQQYFVEKMDERRRDPQQDILSKVVNASIDGETPLENAECLSMLSQIMVAGNETTSASLTEGMWRLIQNPKQYQLVADDPSPAMISNLVEETLRISSPSANMFRRTTKDIEVGDITIPENSVCFARFASANMDAERFPDPERFDVMRPNLKDHVAFGKGVHHCLGAALSRREMNIGFKVIFQRMKDFRLTENASEPEFSPNALLHGLSGLALSFKRAD
ncbi:MAG: cytochrome P450 [bacterium]|nr:cytochrome P450 [Gammaproteobacteria bacterium]